MVSSYVGRKQRVRAPVSVGRVGLGNSRLRVTLAEKLRAGGAAGIPAFYTRTGYGTLIAEGKETRPVKTGECM